MKNLKLALIVGVTVVSSQAFAIRITGGHAGNAGKAGEGARAGDIHLNSTKDTVGGGKVRSITDAVKSADAEKADAQLRKNLIKGDETISGPRKNIRPQVNSVKSELKVGLDPIRIKTSIENGILTNVKAGAEREALIAKLNAIHAEGKLEGFYKKPCDFQTSEQYTNFLRLIGAEDATAEYARMISEGVIRGYGDDVVKACEKGGRCKKQPIVKSLDEFMKNCGGKRAA